MATRWRHEIVHGAVCLAMVMREKDEPDQPGTMVIPRVSYLTRNSAEEE